MSGDFDVVDALAGLAEGLRSEGDFVARLHAAVVTMKKERDEARAEVERLQKRLGDKAEVDSEKLAAAFTEGTIAAGDAMRPHIAVAYQRGAEAMREAAATYLKHASHEDGLGMGSQRMESGIRDLPVPEDKP